MSEELIIHGEPFTESKSTFQVMQERLNDKPASLTARRLFTVRVQIKQVTSLYLLVACEPSTSKTQLIVYALH